MQASELQTLFSRPPASLVWSDGPNGRRIGTCEGFALTLEADGQVQAAGVFAPDAPDLAARNGMLLQLVLAALRPDWHSAGAWLVTQQQLAARHPGARYETHNITRRCVFVFDRAHSRATLRVRP